MIRVKIKIINPTKEIEEGYASKIVMCFNQNIITSLTDIKNQINERYFIYNSIVEVLTDKDGFVIEDNNDIWSYIKYDEIIQVKLKNNLIDKSIENKKIDKINQKEKRKISESDNDSEEIIKSKKKRKLPTIESESSSSSSPKQKKHTIDIDSSSSVSSDEERIQNTTQNESQKTIKEIKTVPLQSNTEESKTNKLLSKKRKRKPKGKPFKQEEEEIEESKLTLIPSDKIDDVDYLKDNHPLLFREGTYLRFKMIELGEDGLEVSNYKNGTVSEYNEENKSFLIRLHKSSSVNQKTKDMLYGDEGDNICIQLKNFNAIMYYDPKGKIQNSNLSENEKERIAIPFIKRQIEYYFSDRNYLSDTYLLNARDENNCKHNI